MRGDCGDMLASLLPRSSRSKMKGTIVGLSLKTEGGDNDEPEDHLKQDQKIAHFLIDFAFTHKSAFLTWPPLMVTFKILAR